MFPEYIQVVDFFCEVKDTLSADDTLFKYKISIDKSLFIKDREGVQPNSWLLKEKTSTKSKIKEQRLEYTHLIKEEWRIAEALKKEKVRVYLDISNSSEIQALEKAISEVKAKKQLTSNELHHLQSYLNELSGYENDYQAYHSYQAQYPEYEIYISPVSGIITEIHKSEYEITYRQEPVMYISKPDKLFVKLYISQNDIKYYHKGEIVKIKFPDGNKTKGIIKEIYLNTEDMPKQFQRPDGRVERGIIAEVHPLSKTDGLEWTPYYKYNVLVSKSKFF